MMDEEEAAAGAETEAERELVERWRSASEEDTRRVGRELAERLVPDGILLLSGDLGAGKTVLTQGLAEALGIDRGDVQSPTFVLVREHEAPAQDDRTAPKRLVHMDLYRLEPEQADRLGLDELLYGPGVTVVEWAERLPYEPGPALHVELRRSAGDHRDIVLSVRGR